MTVRDLIKLLGDCNPSDVVVMQTDTTGYEFEAAASLEPNYHFDKQGKMVYTEEEMSEEDSLPKSQRCVVLFQKE